MWLAFSKAASMRSKVAFGPFVAFQVIALISLPLWFFLWMIFNLDKPVSERDVSIAIYFLFATLWWIPLYLLLGSTGMWLAVVLRLKRAALITGIALCLPLAAFFVILLSQYLEAYY